MSALVKRISSLSRMPLSHRRCDFRIGLISMQSTSKSEKDEPSPKSYHDDRLDKVIQGQYHEILFSDNFALCKSSFSDGFISYLKKENISFPENPSITERIALSNNIRYYGLSNFFKHPLLKDVFLTHLQNMELMKDIGYIASEVVNFETIARQIDKELTEEKMQQNLLGIYGDCDLWLKDKNLLEYKHIFFSHLEFLRKLKIKPYKTSDFSSLNLNEETNSVLPFLNSMLFYLKLAQETETYQPRKELFFDLIKKSSFQATQKDIEQAMTKGTTDRSLACAMLISLEMGLLFATKPNTPLLGILPVPKADFLEEYEVNIVNGKEEVVKCKWRCDFRIGIINMQSTSKSQKDEEPSSPLKFYLMDKVIQGQYHEILYSENFSLCKSSFSDGFLSYLKKENIPFPENPSITDRIALSNNIRYYGLSKFFTLPLLKDVYLTYFQNMELMKDIDYISSEVVNLEVKLKQTLLGIYSDCDLWLRNKNFIDCKHIFLSHLEFVRKLKNEPYTTSDFSSLNLNEETESVLPFLNSMLFYLKLAQETNNYQPHNEHFYDFIKKSNFVATQKDIEQAIANGTTDRNLACASLISLEVGFLLATKPNTPLLGLSLVPKTDCLEDLEVIIVDGKEEVVNCKR